MKLFTTPALFVFLILNTACQKGSEQNILFDKAEDSSYNIFNLKKSGYSYKGNRIYELDVPYPSIHSAFTKRNYLLINHNKVNILTLYDTCTNNYKLGNYKVRYSLTEKLDEYNECDINVVPLIDFTLNEDDTLTYFKDHWIKLDKKFYDNELNDSVYKFRRQWRDKEWQTIIMASKEIGLIGVYDTLLITKSRERIKDPIGKVYLEGLPLKKPTQFKKPNINLRNVEVFNKDS